jgi:arylsulfatase A-like enzyme
MAMSLLTVGSLTWGMSLSSPKKYNVLFIICDDLNDTVNGMGGHPQALTPAIDRLMEQGVQFTNAHCNAPICGPSRASLWTGLYPSVTGYYGYKQQANHWRKFPAMTKAVTMMEHFKSNGYNVYGTGKVFHNGHEDNSVFTTDPFKDTQAGPSSFGPVPWDGVSFHSYGKPSGAGHPGMPPGYEENYWASFGSLEDRPKVNDFEGWMGDWLGKNGDRKTESWRFKYIDKNNRDLMPDEISANFISDKLNENHEKPFFMVCGINRPHVPRYAPQEFFELFPIDSIKLPPYKTNDLGDCAEILFKDPVTGKKDYQAKALPNLLEAGEKTSKGGQYWWKKWIQSYLACTAFADHQIGKMLSALEKSKYKENTIVILTGDHGYHMGEKDHMNKTTIWEEVTRVPYVIKVPGISKEGRTCDHPVSLIDLYPTLIDLCGLPKEPNSGVNNLTLDGYSIKPFLINPENGPWSGPDVALNHLHGRQEITKNTPSPISANHHSVRSRQYRYTLCSDGSEELYDHNADPNEWINLASNKKYAKIKTGLKNKLELLLNRSRKKREAWLSN